MAKRNLVQFQKGMSITTFLKDFGTEEKCAEGLARLRGPSGFKCPFCGRAKHCRLEHTKLPLATWLQAIFLITQGKNGISAMDLMRKIGVFYNAVWRMKHKIMQTMMEREDEKPLAILVHVDDVRRVKALSSSGCESRLVTIAPASSSRAVRGGRDMD